VQSVRWTFSCYPLIRFSRASVFVEATDDADWGIGLPLDSYDCANPAKWKAANCIGAILTGVYRVILMEEA
jgi:hypothetical protein